MQPEVPPVGIPEPLR